MRRARLRNHSHTSLSPAHLQPPSTYWDTHIHSSSTYQQRTSPGLLRDDCDHVSPTDVPAIGPPPPPGTAYLLTAVQIAGIALGGALAVLLLGVFLWLFRRGTFGSGALFGLRPDLGTGNVGAEMSQAGKGAASIGNLTSPFGAERGTSLPSYPSSTLTASVPSLPFIPEAKLHHAPSIAFSIPQAPEPPPPPRSPAVWSTSPSAFDNAYGSIVAGCPSTTCPSTSGSGSRRTPSVSMSDASTLVSERLASISITTPIPSYIASPTPTRDVVSYASSGTRTPSPAPTESVASTIEGVRISSWHSSDSEETELITQPSFPSSVTIRDWNSTYPHSPPLSVPATAHVPNH
ncbi:hypothetical protein L226DRAFT_522256 [Lentinus tigrinus ALCF2SS1-7]|uniref:Uncharacterized protein n=1 Tax=Lentinus tigrinus ALCF2SS1-6 TaxID=1328759 RepID=A0A5C2SB45_9APHY|nr:hypothetical protein L227DRAFT_563382 [Lentinus tigrinus ALCF2SS1-6]RPD75741.1 hypothetical protein L226DRAFT_522256 [Lentinus tigrinus ALCF2SS1-7]